MTRHELKTWPEYFEAVCNGSKTFEIREATDRTFACGDYVCLREWAPDTERYSGRYATARIGYVTAFNQRPGFVVFSLSELRITDGRTLVPEDVVKEADRG